MSRFSAKEKERMDGIFYFDIYYFVIEEFDGKRNENFHHSARNDMSRSISRFFFFLFSFLVVRLSSAFTTRSTFLIAHHGHCRISTCFTTLFTLLSPPLFSSQFSRDEKKSKISAIVSYIMSSR